MQNYAKLTNQKKKIKDKTFATTDRERAQAKLAQQKHLNSSFDESHTVSLRRLEPNISIRWHLIKKLPN